MDQAGQNASGVALNSEVFTPPHPHHHTPPSPTTITHNHPPPHTHPSHTLTTNPHQTQTPAAPHASATPPCRQGARHQSHSPPAFRGARAKAAACTHLQIDRGDREAQGGSRASAAEAARRRRRRRAFCPLLVLFGRQPVRVTSNANSSRVVSQHEWRCLAHSRAVVRPPRSTSATWQQRAQPPSNLRSANTQQRSGRRQAALARRAAFAGPQPLRGASARAGAGSSRGSPTRDPTWQRRPMLCQLSGCSV